MIAQLRGILKRRETDWIIIDVSGVGYRVQIPLTTFYKLPSLSEEVMLHITTLVREDAISLYGFAEIEEKTLFELLLGVSKVGPKLALNLLSGMEAEGLAQAIQQENVLTLKSIPGVGMKTAERIVLELKNKISKALEKAGSDISPVASLRSGTADDAISALVSLGYKKTEAARAVQAVIKANEDSGFTMQNLLKAALARIADKKK